jgi:putative addiction module component (TIGR02574 family)
MSIDQIASEALRLPAKERALLAASLWESVEDLFELSVALCDEEAIALAEARDRELESGAVKPVSHEEMMRRVRG